MNTHQLKTTPVYFAAVERGDKTFEVRKNDRDFQTGDTLLLREWDAKLIYTPPPWPFDPNRPPDPNAKPAHDGYTGRELFAVVSYVLHDTWGQFGIEKGYVVLGLSHVQDHAEIRFEEDFADLPDEQKPKINAPKSGNGRRA